MQAKLVVVGGEAKAAEITLKLPTIIGRGREATLTLPHPLVSRQHCEIFESGGQLFVRDLGSLNGTFIGSQRITEAPLPNGELLTVGTVTFRAVYEEAPLPPQAAPLVNTSTPTPRGSATVKPSISPLSATEKDPIGKSGGTVREAQTAAKTPAPATPAPKALAPEPPKGPMAAKPVAAKPDTAPIEDEDILDLLDAEPPADEPPLDFGEEEKESEAGEEEELDFEDEVPVEPAKPVAPGKPAATSAQPPKPAAGPTPAKPAATPAPSTKPSEKSGTIFIGPPPEKKEEPGAEKASDESLSEFFKRLK